MIVLQGLPQKHILPFLVDIFIKEANWIHELLFPAALLKSFEAWLHSASFPCIHDVEFGLLVVRICAYATQMLPSSTYTADTVCGVSITALRHQLCEQGDELARSCDAAGGVHTLNGLLALCFTVAFFENANDFRAVWRQTGLAIEAVESLNFDSSLRTDSYIDRELKRRLLMNLIDWDR